MAEFVGTIRNISAGRRMLDVHVFDDGIVVAKADAKGMMLRVAGTVAGGGRGFAVADELGNRSEQGLDAAAATASREDLLAADKDNRFVPFAEAARIHLSHPMFPPVYRLEIESDGKRERFEWKRLANEPSEVVAIMRRAVGDRLTTERM